MLVGGGGHGWISVVPPLLTIILALTTKRVLPSLFLGVIAAELVLRWPHPWEAPFVAVSGMIDIATDRGNLILIVFSVMVGGLLALIKAGRGFEAFADLVANGRRGLGRGSVFGINLGIAVTMFLDQWSNVLVNGATTGPLYDRLGISRLRLAYYAHTVSIGVVAMAAINGWGAFYMGLLNAQHVSQPFAFIVHSIPYMLYNWAAILLVPVVMATNLAIGPMKRFDAAAEAHRETPFDPEATPIHEQGGPKPRVVYMLAPLVTLLGSVFVSLWVTGNGDILAGDAGISITYAVALASLVAGGLLLAYRALGPTQIEDVFVGGMAKFFDVGLLIVLALAIGGLTRALGTGPFIAQLAGGSLPAFTLPALVFLLGAVMSFATGTSYGTFSIMLPIALPLAQSSGIDPHLMFGAVISGGLFGDNSSPISDTTIMTTIGTEVSVVDHVASQLPYALVAGIIALAGFLALGALS